MTDLQSLNNVQLKSTFPPWWEFLVKTSCPHWHCLSVPACSFLDHAQPWGLGLRPHTPPHPAPAAKAQGQVRVGRQGCPSPALVALGTAVHSVLLWPPVSMEPCPKDARLGCLQPLKEVFFRSHRP